MLDEITKLYYEVYVPGLGLFFESKWFNLNKDVSATKNPLSILHNNHPIIGLFTSFLESISSVKSTDPADMTYPGHLETIIVWALAGLPNAIETTRVANHRPQDPLPADDDPLEVRSRLHVFEALLTGGTLNKNLLFPPPIGTVVPAKRNEIEFWYYLAQYLRQGHSSSSPADRSMREHYLGLMRSVLDGRENRDVLYSIAVLREYTAYWDAPSNEQVVPARLEESDPRCKLAVATRFIRDESATTGGTTNVVRRFADLACRAFVRPGANVNRRS